MADGAKIVPMVNQARAISVTISAAAARICRTRRVFLLNLLPEGAMHGCESPRSAFLCCLQLEWHPMCWIPEMITFANKHNITLQAYSSLGSGDDRLMGHPVVQEVQRHKPDTARNGNLCCRACKACFAARRQNEVCACSMLCVCADRSGSKAAAVRCVA